MSNIISNNGMTQGVNNIFKVGSGNISVRLQENDLWSELGFIRDLKGVTEGTQVKSLKAQNGSIPLSYVNGLTCKITCLLLEETDIKNKLYGSLLLKSDYKNNSKINEIKKYQFNDLNSIKKIILDIPANSLNFNLISIKYSTDSWATEIDLIKINIENTQLDNDNYTVIQFDNKVLIALKSNVNSVVSLKVEYEYNEIDSTKIIVSNSGIFPNCQIKIDANIVDTKKNKSGVRTLFFPQVTFNSLPNIDFKGYDSEDPIIEQEIEFNASGINRTVSVLENGVQVEKDIVVLFKEEIIWN